MAQFLFDDERYTARIHERALADHADAPQLGVLEQAGLGVMRGGAQMARTAGLAAGAVAGLGGTNAQDAVFEFADDSLTDALHYWTPDPRTTTTAGRIVGGLAEVALPLLAGGGNPTALMANAAFNSAERVSDAGAGPLTSAAVGMLDAAAIAAGFRIPAVGSTLARSLALGVASNPVLGAVTEGAQGALLSATGNDAAAAMFDPFDLERRGVETLLGLAFGGLAHTLARGARGAAPDADVPPAPRDAPAGSAFDVEPVLADPPNPLGLDTDALLTYRNAQHLEAAAPGAIPDLRTANAHARAMREQLEAFAEGREADIGRALGDVQFPRPTALDDGVRAAEVELAPVLEAHAVDLDSYDRALPPRQRAEAVAAREDIADTQNRLAALDEDPPLVLEDGTTTTARAALAQVDANVERVRTGFGPAVEAAITCMLRRI
ncbi:MAG TPA: hypothetical protein PJ986_04590 [Gammaproteobacteria bacterium]|nr:hypothetical protein [Gammaproteobacteria bacterium]